MAERIVYHAAGAGIVHNLRRNKQVCPSSKSTHDRWDQQALVLCAQAFDAPSPAGPPTSHSTQSFYLKHTDDIISLAANPKVNTIIATGQLGEAAPIHIWNADSLDTLSILQVRPAGPPVRAPYLVACPLPFALPSSSSTKLSNPRVRTRLASAD